MSDFLRLLHESDKARALANLCARLRNGEVDSRHFNVPAESFDAITGKPFAYWVSDSVRSIFARFQIFEVGGRKSSGGIGSTDDFRFIRTWWEVIPSRLTMNQQLAIEKKSAWVPIAQGGGYSPFYSKTLAVFQYGQDGFELKSFIEEKMGSASRNVRAQSYYFKAGLTWPLRGEYFSSWPLPAGSLFSVAGKMAYAPQEELLYWLAVFNSKPYDYLLRLFAGKVGGVQYQSGLIGQLPVPAGLNGEARRLSALARQSWQLKRSLDAVDEISHAFLMPSLLARKIGTYRPEETSSQLATIQQEIDEAVIALYGMNSRDRDSVLERSSTSVSTAVEADEAVEFHQSVEELADSDDIAAVEPLSLLSWGVGVAFGRFDWRLATGEREVPAEPDPFDPLPARSPGMLPEGADPFREHAGILIDDPGHPHDLARLVEEVLTRVEAPVPDDVRRWLQRDFFAFHLQRYSKSRRKAPIYWPLSTTSGSYTLWVYYPSLTSQTLYTAINDFIEPKLKQVGADVTALRNKGAARTRDDEKQFEALLAFELELIELRDTLLKLAPTYQPHHDDGVQISAAPLWPLFRHKPWQKVLNDTWAKLEKGDYDWAHLAMNYWPDRVREKCKSDKSLAIAHGLEDMYIEPQPKPKQARGRKAKGE